MLLKESKICDAFSLSHGVHLRHLPNLSDKQQTSLHAWAIGERKRLEGKLLYLIAPGCLRTQLSRAQFVFPKQGFQVFRPVGAASEFPWGPEQVLQAGEGKYEMQAAPCELRELCCDAMLQS